MLILINVHNKYSKILPILSKNQILDRAPFAGNMESKKLKQDKDLARKLRNNILKKGLMHFESYSYNNRPQQLEQQQLQLQDHL
jgi:hypothetical protein